jgi:predicted lipid-binding transport protein (Tim44 family)
MFMLKGLLGIILFIICAIILLLMLTGGIIVRTIKKMRQEAIQAAERQARQYRDETGRQRRQQYTQRQQTGSYSSHTSAAGRTSTTDYSRTTAQAAPADEPNQKNYYDTASGETIIDNRQQRNEQKIFDDSDGEYVEFTEEK